VKNREIYYKIASLSVIFLSVIFISLNFNNIIT
jgi:hypothetical protein